MTVGHRLLVAAISGVTLLFVATSCGSPPQGPAETTHAFVTRVNQICSASSAKVKNISPPGQPTEASLSNLSAWARYLEAIIPPLQAEHMDFTDLRVPADLGQRFRRLIADQGRAVTFLERSASAATNGDLAGFRAAMAEFQDFFARTNSSARALGLDSCSS